MSLIQGSRVMSLPLSRELNFVFKAKRQCSLNLHPACQLEIALGQLTANSIRTDRARTHVNLDETEGSRVCYVCKTAYVGRGHKRICCLLRCEGRSAAVFLRRISPLSSTPLRWQTDHSTSSSLCYTSYILQIKAMWGGQLKQNKTKNQPTAQ